MPPAPVSKRVETLYHRVRSFQAHGHGHGHSRWAHCACMRRHGSWACSRAYGPCRRAEDGVDGTGMRSNLRKAQELQGVECFWAFAPCRRPLSVRHNCHCLGVACFWASAPCRRPLSVRHNCHWLPCGRAKRVRHIVYRVFDLGLRPLPPAPLSKYSYYYEYTHVLGLPPPAAGPFQHACR